MKVGSIVECINAGIDNGIYEHKPLKQGGIYTIREIVDGCVTWQTEDNVLLEEIVNPIHTPSGLECSYKISRFRELLPPMEIQSALDECEPVLIEAK